MKLQHRITNQIDTANKELAFEIPEKINLKEAQKIAADHGWILKKDRDSSEFIIYPKGKKDEDYWTNDLQDALGTMRAELKRSGKLKEKANSEGTPLSRALDYMDNQLREMRKLIDKNKISSVEDFNDTMKGAYKRTLTKLKKESAGGV